MRFVAPNVYSIAAAQFCLDTVKACCVCRERGFARIGLSTMPANAAAIALYESAGFRPPGEIDGDEAVYVLVESRKGASRESTRCSHA